MAAVLTCPECQKLNTPQRYRHPVMCIECSRKRGSPEYARAKEKLTIWGLSFKELVPETLRVKIGEREYEYVPTPGKWWVVGESQRHTKSFFRLAWAVMPKEQKVALVLQGIDPAVNNGWGPEK